MSSRRGAAKRIESNRVPRRSSSSIWVCTASFNASSPCPTSMTTASFIMGGHAPTGADFLQDSERERVVGRPSSSWKRKLKLRDQPLDGEIALNQSADRAGQDPPSRSKHRFARIFLVKRSAIGGLA